MKHSVLSKLGFAGVVCTWAALLMLACDEGSTTIPKSSGSGGSGGGNGGSSSGGSSSGGSSSVDGCLTGEKDVPSTCSLPGELGSTAQGSCKCSTLPVNFAYCACDSKVSDCDASDSNHAEACGVLAKFPTDPTGALKTMSRSSQTEEYSDPTGKPVDVSCFDTANPPKAGTSKTVKIQGYARNFSAGCDVAGLQIEVYKVKRTGGADDGMPGDLIATTVVEDQPCSSDTPDVCKLVETPKCNPRKWRTYSIDGVPSETELIIRTMSAQGHSDFVSLWDYNMYISNDDPDLDSNDVWHHDVRGVLASDYQTIPNTAGFGAIAPGNGAIAGEVHDCGNIRVLGAAVATNVSNAGLGYFSDNEDEPLPVLSGTQDYTSTLGLYAIYDAPEGKARVSAVGVRDNNGTNELVSLGYYDVHVFPDAITAITFRGLRPFQVQEAK